MTALPLAETLALHDPNTLKAYNIVLEAERSAQSKSPAEQTNVLSARILGYLLLNLYDYEHILGDAPLAHVVNEILSGDTSPDRDAVIYNHSVYYRERLLRAFLRTKRPNTQPSDDNSPVPFQNLEDMLNDYLEDTPMDYRSIKKAALARDGFRCVITGAYDKESASLLRVLKKSARKEGKDIVNTHCTYILGESTDHSIALGDPEECLKAEYATSVSAVLKAFGLQEIVQRLGAADGIHTLSNVLTLRTTIHEFFSELDLWLEATDQPNTYKVKLSDNVVLRECPTEVTFKVSPNIQEPNRTTAMLPDRRLITLHAICARVFHMSGAADYLFPLNDDRDETPDLAADGSSTNLLDDVLVNAALSATKEFASPIQGNGDTSFDV